MAARESTARGSGGSSPRDSTARESGGSSPRDSTAGGSRGSPPRDSTAETAGHPPYEQARDELTELVRRLEAGGLTLEESLKLWERGEELAAICEEWLEGARARLAAAGKPDGQDRTGREPGAPF